MSHNTNYPEARADCQASSNVDLSITIKPPAGALWNSAIGRRAFLKRTGGATLATALALHGTRVQVQAVETSAWKIKTYKLILQAGVDADPVHINVSASSAEAAANAATTALLTAVSDAIGNGSWDTNINTGWSYNPEITHIDSGGILLAVTSEITPGGEDEEEWGSGEFTPTEGPPGTWTVDITLNPPPLQTKTLFIEWHYQD